jgi:hypothetical protein
VAVTKVSETGSEWIIEQITAQFPRWHVWRGRRGDGTPGDLMATRDRSDLTDAELAAGLAVTLPLGLSGDLRAQLAEQERLERALGGGR